MDPGVVVGDAVPGPLRGYAVPTALRPAVAHTLAVPLAGWTAPELAKLPTYYVMDHHETMAETVAKEMPTPQQIAGNLEAIGGRGPHIGKRCEILRQRRDCGGDCNDASSGPGNISG